MLQQPDHGNSYATFTPVLEVLALKFPVRMSNADFDKRVKEVLNASNSPFNCPSDLKAKIDAIILSKPGN